jgi:hypothetical protein
MYTYLGVCMCASVHVYIKMCVCVHVCMYIYIYIYIGVCVCVCVPTVGYAPPFFSLAFSFLLTSTSGLRELRISISCVCMCAVYKCLCTHSLSHLHTLNTHVPMASPFPIRRCSLEKHLCSSRTPVRSVCVCLRKGKRECVRKQENRHTHTHTHTHTHV